jgi:hypothetical protein
LTQWTQATEVQPLTDRLEKLGQHDDRKAPEEIESGRRAYVPPELVEYGSVSKLTQTGTGSFSDFGMMMMTCL